MKIEDLPLTLTSLPDYSPDGSRIAVPAADGTVRVLDRSTLRELHVLGTPVDFMQWRAVAFSPTDADRLAVVGGSFVRLFHAGTGKLVWEKKLGDAWIVAFGASGLIGVGRRTYGGNLLQIFDHENGRCVKKLERVATNRMPDHVAFSPDGALMGMIASGSLEVWEVASGTLLPSSLIVCIEEMDPSGLRVVKQSFDDRAITALAFAPDGKTIAVGNSKAKKRVALHDARTGAVTAELDTPEARALAFAPDGSSIAAITCDGEQRNFRLVLIDLATKKEQVLLKEKVKALAGLVFSPDGSEILSRKHASEGPALVRCVLRPPGRPVRPVAVPTTTKPEAPKAARTAKPATPGAEVRYELVEGTSSKFWAISLSGESLTTRYGRIGTDGQTTTKTFESAAKARKEHDKLVAEKTKKGYAAASGPPEAGDATGGLRALLEENGLERVSKRILALAKPAVRLALEPGKKLPPGASRLGGAPDLPDGLEWPTADDEPLVFIAQIKLSELPPSGLPERGMLYFFNDSNGEPSGRDETDGEGFRVLYHEDEDGPFAKAKARGQGLTPCRATVKAFSSLPRSDAPEIGKLGLSDEEARAYVDAYDSWTSVRPLHQLLGHPLCLENDVREDMAGDDGKPGDWTILLQLDSDEALGADWGGGGLVYFGAHAKDVARGRFARAARRYQFM